jgi:hypothetical protein
MNPVECLTNQFAGYLDSYRQNTPLNSAYKQYLATVALRKGFSGASEAISSDEFVRNMHETLRGFFRLGMRAAGLLPLDLFTVELRTHAGSIGSFDDTIVGTELTQTHDDLWSLISTLRITAAKARVVSGSKALHLLLPDLVVPIDRRYTGAFLYRYGEEFEPGTDEQKTLLSALAVFRTIAKKAQPETYVGKFPVHATRTKVIDNGIIGFVEQARKEYWESRSLTPKTSPSLIATEKTAVE